MDLRRSQVVAAGILVLATAVAGVAARGSGRDPAPAPTNTLKTAFAAPRTGPVSFTGTLDRTAVLAGQDGVVRMELILGAAADPAKQLVRRPTDLVVVLDRSGSMAGDKLEEARAAIRALLAQLGTHDRFALVTYSDGAELSIPLAAVGDQDGSPRFAAIDAIRPSGGTNMSSGLDLGLATIDGNRVPERVARMILISDGLANQGDASNEGLTRRARRAAQGEYMLSTVGVGKDFNEYLMTALADAGTGNYYYVQDSQELASIFAREFDSARTTVASALAVQIEPGHGVKVIDAAGYPLENGTEGVTFRPGALFAGQERRIWVTLAVPQQAAGDYDLGRFSLSYGTGLERATLSFTDMPRVACVTREDQFYAGIDVGTWGRSVTVDAYNQMQELVARDVKEGRRDQALQHLTRFRDETATLNARLKSAPVAKQLVDLDKLEADVSAAFAGPGQEARQNELSKAASAQAVDSRRAGSK